ncbi:MAG: helical backbone metal receptor [Thermoprotei archaeon]|nr:helical backbone metal receptor [Thermoprotei archaeon]
MVQRMLYVMLGSIVILMILGFALLYASVSGLRGEIEGHSRALEELRVRFEGQREALRDVEELKSRLDRIEKSLGNVASAEELKSIAREVGELSAMIGILESRIKGSNETLTAFIANVSASISEISRRVNELSERLLFPAVIVDGAGDRVVILSRPSKVVSLAPSATETLYFMGALNLIVGVDDFSDFPRVVKEGRDRGEIASIGGFWTPSVEKIVGLKPDLVVGVASVPSHRALKAQLSAYGIPVLLLPNSRASDVVESLLIAGRALGRLPEAYRIAYQVELAFKYAALLSTKLESKVSVSAVVWVKPLFVVGGGTWQHDILEYAGLINVYGDMKLWPSVSPETLLERVPEAIIMTTGHGMVSREDLVNQLVGVLGDSAYKIPALRDGRIYGLSGAYEDAFNRPSPRTIIALYVLLVVFHPQLFDLKPGDIPYDVSPETLDVAVILRDKVPGQILELIELGLRG